MPVMTGRGPSPSALAIQALQKLYGKCELTDLPPEDILSLYEEIRHFQRKTARKMKVDKKS